MVAGVCRATLNWVRQPEKVFVELAFGLLQVDVVADGDGALQQALQVLLLAFNAFVADKFQQA